VTAEIEQRVFSITRPAPALLKYYIGAAFAFLPVMPFALVLDDPDQLSSPRATTRWELPPA